MSRCTNEQINCLIFRAGHRNTLLLSIYLKRNKFPLDIYAKRPTTCGFLNLCDCEFWSNKHLKRKSVEIHSDSRHGSNYIERCRWILGSSYIYAGLVWEKLWGMIELQNIFVTFVYLYIKSIIHQMFDEIRNLFYYLELCILR